MSVCLEQRVHMGPYCLCSDIVTVTCTVAHSMNFFLASWPLPVPPVRNLHWSLCSVLSSVAAWTFLTHSHGNYSTLRLCSLLHFLTASPFKWLCAKLKQAFIPPPPQLFFPFGQPPHLPHQIQWITHIHALSFLSLLLSLTHTCTNTHLHPNYILPFVYRQEVFVGWNTQPGLQLQTFL